MTGFFKETTVSLLFFLWCEYGMNGVVVVVVIGTKGSSDIEAR